MGERLLYTQKVVGSMPTAPIMQDGLYQVKTSYLCAGFVVRNGRLAECAPILRKKIHYWKTIARRVND